MFKWSLLRMRTNRALKNNKTEHSSIPYKKAAQIGIIFTVEDKQKHHDIKEFIHRLENDGKKVQVLEFLPEKKENYEFRFDFFTARDLNFWGTLDSPVANQFINQPFDYLFYIDKESNPLILHLLARSKARCRVGKYHESESPFFELMIEENGSIKNLIENMYNYTHQLR
jgi:hypothetical protein